MNQLTNPSSTPVTSMTSQEIADLTGKEHRNVTRDIRHMLTELGMGVLSFEQTHQHPQNKQLYKVFVLPKDLTLTLVSGYSIPMRHRIVTRWQELEAAQVRLLRFTRDLPGLEEIPQPVAKVLMDAKKVGHSIQDVMDTLADILHLIAKVETQKVAVAKLPQKADTPALPNPHHEVARAVRPIPRPSRIANGMVHLHRDHLLSVAELLTP